jgi:dienelactone hydrolase
MGAAAKGSCGQSKREEQMYRLLLTTGAILGAAVSAAMAEPSVTDLAARIELRAIETLTLSDQQFLSGDKSGAKSTMIAGELRLPRGGTGKFPAVVLLHGSGGVGPGPEFWAKQFNEMGIASYVLDSFTGRNIVSTSTNQALLGRLNMIVDAYRAFDMLADHARIDPARIAVMGFSRGGQSALYSSMNRFREMWNPRARFAAHIPLYASCTTTFIGDTDVSGVPIRQYHGLADDYVTIAPCRPYFERLQKAGRDAKLIELPDAHHAYDNPLGPKTPTMARGSESTKNCVLEEKANGLIVNAKSGEPFTYKDACVSREPHIGYNEAATNTTRKEVSALLRTVFKIE